VEEEGWGNDTLGARQTSPTRGVNESEAVEVECEADVPADQVIAQTNTPEGRVGCNNGVRGCPQRGVGHAERREGGRRCEGSVRW
jgi:hypothetical protein